VFEISRHSHNVKFYPVQFAVEDYISVLSLHGTSFKCNTLMCREIENEQTILPRTCFSAGNKRSECVQDRWQLKFHRASKRQMIW